LPILIESYPSLNERQKRGENILKETIKSFLHLVAEVECFEYAVGRVLLRDALRAICPDNEAAPAKIGSAITSRAPQIRHQNSGRKKRERRRTQGPPNVGNWLGSKNVTLI